jgi:hypothetical protein
MNRLRQRTAKIAHRLGCGGVLLGGAALSSLTAFAVVADPGSVSRVATSGGVISASSQVCRTTFYNYGMVIYKGG